MLFTMLKSTLYLLKKSYCFDHFQLQRFREPENIYFSVSPLSFFFASIHNSKVSSLQCLSIGAFLSFNVLKVKRWYIQYFHFTVFKILSKGSALAHRSLCLETFATFALLFDRAEFFGDFKEFVRGLWSCTKYM